TPSPPSSPSSPAPARTHAGTARRPDPPPGSPASPEPNSLGRVGARSNLVSPPRQANFLTSQLGRHRFPACRHDGARRGGVEGTFAHPFLADARTSLPPPPWHLPC